MSGSNTTQDFSPQAWGWKGEFFADYQNTQAPHPDRDSAAAPRLSPARVVGRERHDYRIVCPDFSEILGPGPRPGPRERVRVSGRFEHEATSEADYPAVGDWVLVDPTEDCARIHKVLRRITSLSRTEAGDRAAEQVLAANLDSILLVFALDGGRNYLLRFLERALIVARASGANPCVVLNKLDLADPELLEKARSELSRNFPDLPRFEVSAKSGQGLAELRAYLCPGETIGMLGKSGVGKSALVNALGSGSLGSSPLGSGSLESSPLSAEPIAVDTGGEASTGAESLGQRPLSREGQVRADDLRGRHTTTSSRLYRLDSGLLLIDSPGIRELRILGEADDLGGGFPEIAELAQSCRFADCSHAGEPGCAIAAALESGQLDPARHRAWQDLRREQAWQERRDDQRAKAEHKRKWKQISKFQKELKKRD